MVNAMTIGAKHFAFCDFFQNALSTAVALPSACDIETLSGRIQMVEIEYSKIIDSAAGALLAHFLLINELFKLTSVCVAPKVRNFSVRLVPFSFSFSDFVFVLLMILLVVGEFFQWVFMHSIGVMTWIT
jgi:hypothetical protein